MKLLIREQDVVRSCTGDFSGQLTVLLDSVRASSRRIELILPLAWRCLADAKFLVGSVDIMHYELQVPGEELNEAIAARQEAQENLTHVAEVLVGKTVEEAALTPCGDLLLCLSGNIRIESFSHHTGQRSWKTRVCRRS